MLNYLKECSEQMQGILEEREHVMTDFYHNSNSANDSLGLREVKKLYDSLRASILPESYDEKKCYSVRIKAYLIRETIKAFEKHGVRRAYRQDLINDGYSDLVYVLDQFNLWKCSGE